MLNIKGFCLHVNAAVCLSLIYRLPVGSFNIAKVIVVGDVAVGKTCLISR